MKSLVTGQISIKQFARIVIVVTGSTGSINSG